MYIINIMWLVAPVALLTILFILLISKSLIKGKKVFFAFFVLILIYAILGVACYYFYEAFLSNQYISLLISLSCIGLGGFINLIIVYLGIAKLKRKDSKEELLRLQHDIEKNIQVEDKWFNILFSYTADRWTVSDINTDLFSKLDEGNFEENDAEIIEMNKEIKNINEKYKFLKKNLRRKYFFLKNLKSIINLENKDEVKKLITKRKLEFSLSKETDKTIELIKTLSNELLNLVKLGENDNIKNIEENLSGTINYMSGILYNQLRNEKSKIKDKTLRNLYSDLMVVDNLNIDTVRDIIKKTYTSSHEGGAKVFILKNIQDIRKESANAMLKIIEEPTRDNFFILISKRLNILSTIKSRSIIYRVRKSTPEELGVDKYVYNFFLGISNDIAEYKEQEIDLMLEKSYKSIAGVLKEYEKEKNIVVKIDLYKCLRNFVQESTSLKKYEKK